MKVIIAGGRHFIGGLVHQLWLDNWQLMVGFTEVVSGACTGADAFGEAWAVRNGILVSKHPANWAKHGNAAGPIRNAEMADYAAGGYCLLFSGGRGTSSMKAIARSKGLKVAEYPYLEVSIA